MALALLYQDRVLYSCTCSQLSPLSELFFCRHCKVPRCQDCVSSTVESFFCPHCFDSASIMSDVKSRKGRCNHCFQCPRCFSTLTTRSIIVPSEVLGDQSPQKRDRDQTGASATSPVTPLRGALSATSSLKSPGGTKLYFLSCSHCKWTTRDVNIKDKRSPIDFKDRPSPHHERIAELVNFYKEYANRDYASREKAKKPPTRRQRSYGSLLDPSKFHSAKSLGGPDSPSALRRGNFHVVWDDAFLKKMEAKATSEPLPPSEELYSTKLNLQAIPTLKQQLMDPAYQPKSCDEFSPRQLRLTGKKLHRCKGCDHILMKAEMNPSSIRFKIQQIALHTFPQIRIVEFPKMEAGSESEVLISVTNPVNYAVNVSFEDCSPEMLKHVKENLVKVSLPQGEFMLTPNDDVGDLLDGDGESEINDDPNFVLTRLPGKLILKFAVTPEIVSESTKFMFTMKFLHKSTIEADKQNEMCAVTVPVLVKLCKPTS